MGLPVAMTLGFWILAVLMSLAILRVSGPTFPAKFHLDDALAMSPAMKLSDFPVVKLVARVSRSGNVQAQPGDFEGSVASVRLGTASLNLVIDRVVP